MSFLRQLGWELSRMFTRKRTYIGFGVFLAVEAVFYFLWTRDRAQRGMEQWIEQLAGGFGFEHYFSALTLAFFVVAFTLILLGAIFIALVTGDIVAKESEDGTLRMLLSRPISRFRLLAIKFVACNIYAMVLYWFVGLTAFGVGLLDRGWGGGMIVWAPELRRASLFEWTEGLQRYFLAITAFSFAYLPVIGLSFFLSCLKIKPSAATIVTVAVILADQILMNIPIPVFSEYRDYSITSRMDYWIDMMRQEIPWPLVAENSLWLLGVGITGFVLGWTVFERRDVKS